MAPEERTEALEALDKEQLSQYLGMVGKDGWCKYYDTGKRICRIYHDRPDFCRTQSLAKIFKQEESQVKAFAISCCVQQIRTTYGGKSLEMRKFKRAINS